MSDPLPLFEPKDALAYFVRKGLKIGYSWLDVQREEHDKAFTVAKAMTRELLEDIQSAVETALREGQTLAQFAKGLRPKLVERGWWGKKLMIDPLTGEQKVAQLGSPRRLATIYRTNMRTSYASGRWARISRNKAAFPLLRYVSVLDGRERPEHRAWHDTVLPVEDDWWSTHYPPCDWGCRCRAIALNARMLERKGLEVTNKPAFFGTRRWTNKRTGEVRTIEKGIGAGWDYHPGKSAVEGMAPDPLPRDFGQEEAAARLRGQEAFDRVFGLSAENGWSAVFIDVGGWPVAIARSMVADESAERISALTRLLTRPELIRWVWVRDESGNVVLMRRYRRGAELLDIGRLGWRLGRMKRPRTIAAGYNPRQARDKNGRWTSCGGFASSAATNPGMAGSIYLGRADDSSPAGTAGFARSMSADTIRHALKKHGEGGYGRDRFPITPADFAHIPKIIAGGASEVRVSRGMASLTHRSEIDGARYVYAERIGRKRGNRLTMRTFYRES